MTGKLSDLLRILLRNHGSCSVANPASAASPGPSPHTRVQKVIRCMKSFVVSITSVIQPLPEICSLVVVGGVNCLLMLTVGQCSHFPWPWGTDAFLSTKRSTKKHLKGAKALRQASAARLVELGVK